VHLVDGQRHMGGHLRWFAQLPGFRPWARLTEFREQAIASMRGVQFAHSTHLDFDGVLDYGATVVIVATGARWSPDGLTWVTHDPIPGADATLAHVLTPEQLLLEGKQPPGVHVVVVDGEGELVGAGVAQFLQQQGYRTDLVTPWPVVAIHAEHGGEAPIMRRELVDGGAELITSVTVTQIRPDGITCVDEYERERTIGCDAVVLATQRVSHDDLYTQLAAAPERLAEAGIAAVHRAGDCAAPRLLAEATFEGHLIGRLLRADGTLADDPAIGPRA
jgi:dimethylamine/trimethylamine dehydrogenase